MKEPFVAGNYQYSWHARLEYVHGATHGHNTACKGSMGTLDSNINGDSSAHIECFCTCVKNSSSSRCVVDVCTTYVLKMCKLIYYMDVEQN